MDIATKAERSSGGVLARRTLAAGLGIGVLADYLLWGQFITGPGLAILVTLIMLAAQWLNRHEEIAWRRTLAGWSAVGLAAALMLVFRDSPPLAALMLLLMLTASAMVAMQAGQGQLAESSVRDHLQAFAFLPLRMFMGLIPLLREAEFGGQVSARRLTGIVRGLVLVAPLIVVFTALFSSADEVFGRFAAQLGDLLSLSLPRHLLVILMFATLATGLLLCSFRRAAAIEARGKRFSLGTEETAVILGALCLLFLVFVVLQMSYLFGGRETIELTGLTLAEYARRGFFELLAASALTLTVLLLISGTDCNRTLFRPLTVVLILCVLIILASAAQRLNLYMMQFGLTLSRVLAVAVMVWLAYNLIAFGVTILRGSSRGFAAGMTLSGILIILLLALMNPSAVVARVNVVHAAGDDHVLDVNYLAELGADAVPAIVANFDLLAQPAQCVVAARLLSRWGGTSGVSSDDWRSWNYGRAAARRAVSENRERLLEERQSPADAAATRPAPGLPPPGLVSSC